VQSEIFELILHYLLFFTQAEYKSEFQKGIPSTFCVVGFWSLKFKTTFTGGA